MPRTAKSPKNVNSPKTATTTEVDVSEDKKEKPAKEIPVIHDEGFFQHDTGDTYDGEFEAKKKDQSVKMHGQGVYTTAEGDRYTGHWEADKLIATNLTIISYHDGSKFEGLIKEWGYTGHGKYTYPDGSVLTCEFNDNCPVGHLVLTDPNGHIWLGTAEHGYGWCEPVNHFYEMLETTQARSKRRHKNVSEEELQAPSTKTSPSTKGSPTSKGADTVKGSTSLKDSPTLQNSPSLKSSPSVKGSPSLKASLTVKDSPSLNASHTVKDSPSLKASPTVKDSPSLKASPTVKDSPSLKASPTVKDSPSLKATPTVKDSPSLKASPTVKDSPSMKASPTLKRPPSKRTSPAKK